MGEEKEESVWGVKMAGAEGEADGRKSTEETSVTAHAELRRIDSLNLEAGRVSMNAHKMGWRITLSLAFQSLGIVYGDIGTSPLYAKSSLLDVKSKKQIQLHFFMYKSVILFQK
ncbi:hypothetical protein VIGAN_02341000 [Vigna angularis var. angularis]|uniref:K+ potassium transporter integral membrane domain-containing protein n=1 Tax=Vigna angularis var. angularis TaxID=157739 RepID=A0A0S3RIP7_PHAAN|nr:hypothetical protein VIGAN_02341000 [Vigna angularis var. angularis]